MANTIRWYDEKWNTLAAIAIGTDSLIEGVHMDGDGDYWIVDQTTDKVECYRLENGAFTMVKQYSITGYNDPWGITGDEGKLYIGVTKTEGFPLVSNIKIICMEKDTGAITKEFQAVSTNASLTTGRDLTFDRMNLIYARSVTTTPITRYIDTIDISSDKVVHTTANLARVVESIAFDGMNIRCTALVSGSSRGNTLGRDGTFLGPGTVALPQISYGMTFVSNKKGLPIDYYEGQTVAVAHRA